MSTPSQDRAHRQLSFAEAIRDALALALRRDSRVFVIGLGVPDPKGCFATTLGLQAEFGPDRVMDMPCSENGVTGVVLGAALNGLRPILSHQRLEFGLLSIDQICTQAANWHYMFGGAMKMPLVVRMIVGRGWGQGPQHSQSLHAWFAHVPGLKVVMPTSPHDAKGLLLAAIEDDNPVVFLEHRWLHPIRGPVPEDYYTVPIGPARVVRPGNDISIVAFSYMVLEALEAARRLEDVGVNADVIDMRSLRPLDGQRVIASVRRTGRLLVADHAWAQVGMSAEIIALVSEAAYDSFRVAPRRICLPACPTPTSPALAAAFYPRAGQITAAARELLGLPPDPADHDAEAWAELDKPSPSFTGPF